MEEFTAQFEDMNVGRRGTRDWTEARLAKLSPELRAIYEQVPQAQKAQTFENLLAGKLKEAGERQHPPSSTPWGETTFDRLWRVKTKGGESKIYTEGQILEAFGKIGTKVCCETGKCGSCAVQLRV